MTIRKPPPRRRCQQCGRDYAKTDMDERNPRLCRWCGHKRDISFWVDAREAYFQKVTSK